MKQKKIDSQTAKHQSKERETTQGSSYEPVINTSG